MVNEAHFKAQIISRSENILKKQMSKDISKCVNPAKVLLIKINSSKSLNQKPQINDVNNTPCKKT